MGDEFEADDSGAECGFCSEGDSLLPPSELEPADGEVTHEDQGHHQSGSRCLEGCGHLPCAHPSQSDEEQRDNDGTEGAEADTGHGRQICSARCCGVHSQMGDEVGDEHGQERADDGDG